MPTDSGGKRITNGALVAGTATVTFAARYSEVELKNFDTTNILYARTDGVTPASPWNDSFSAGPGERIAVPNTDPLYWQGEGTDDGTTVILVSATATAGFSVVGDD